MDGRVVLVGGGVRSGKSAFALARARSLSDWRVFVATAQAFDDEMRARIALHKQERGPDFSTLEVPTEVPGALAQLVSESPADKQPMQVVLVDCLTIWLSNLLLADESQSQILRRVDQLIDVLATRRLHSVVVTNEVGMGVVPESSLGRAFRDLTGIAHQRLARASDETYVAILGSVLRIKPGPVELQDGGAFDFALNKA